jgi:DNA helicase-2/ATP-dependent DNA helicase PcrA
VWRSQPGNPDLIATDELLGGLLPAQRDAVIHRGGPLLVIGEPGSGKTRVIQARFRWLVAQGCEPERVAVLVPSTARAIALREVLEPALDRGYERLYVLTPMDLAALILRGAGGYPDSLDAVLGAGDRLAMLVERIDELSLRHHDFGGRVNVLLAGFVARIDRLKAELIGPEEYLHWAASLDLADRPEAELEREFAEIYAAHERILAEVGGSDSGNLVRQALAVVQQRPESVRPFDQVLIDDAQELDLAPARLARQVAGSGLTVAGDPLATLRRFRAAGHGRMHSFEAPGTRIVTLTRSLRCPKWVLEAACAILERPAREGGPGGGPGDGPEGGPEGGPGGGPGGGPEGGPGDGPEGDGPEGGPGDGPEGDGPEGGPEGSPGDGPQGGPGGGLGGELELWRCANDRTQAQSVARDIERLIARESVAPGRIAVLVPDATREGQAVALALEERAVAHRLVGEAAFFQRAEIRDVLAWLRLLADPSDATAVVRALARAPVELRSVDIARCTQIARRRKLDMVAALAAALESPQVPPEARERIRVFLKLYRSGISAIDTTRPDLYVHRLIDRLGLRRQQLFAAQADVVERLRALASFGELASAYVRRSPQATPREFARSIAAVADFGLREQEEPELHGADAVQVLSLAAAGGLECDHVYVLGLHAGLALPAPEPIPDALLREELPLDSEDNRRAALRQALYVAVTRAGRRLVLCYPRADDRGGALAPSPLVQRVLEAVDGSWNDKEEELFGPAETLHATYRLLRDELLQGTMRAGGRLGELRFDTDLDVSHAVVRYLELLKVAALIARPEGHGVADALRDINSRILQAVTSEQREIFTSSALDDYLLDAERDVRRRAQVIASRDEPSLEPFLPKRGDGVVLSASDIDTYRTCPLKYKFARVFRIPQQPTLHQRFGILVHQVLERFHAGDSRTLPELFGLLEAGWRRGGFGDSEEERQLRAKATAALTRYYERFQSQESQPMWFERQFTFKLGPHLLRGRVDRVDRLPSGEYELIDYKTGRPKSPAQLVEDVQLSLYAVGAREAWRLEASRQAYYYLLDDQKVAVSSDERDRGDWVREVALEVADGILSQGFEPTPSLAACSICDYRLVCPAVER